jgi:hypothetical protein
MEKILKNSVLEMDLIKVQITGIERPAQGYKNRLSTLEEQVKQQKDSLGTTERSGSKIRGPQKEGSLRKR